MRLVFFLFPRTVWKTEVREGSDTLENGGTGGGTGSALRSTEKSCRNVLSAFRSRPQTKRAKCPLQFLEQCRIKGTYADVAVTSCHPLAMFCFSSWSELIPSFRLISVRCFSFAANTWDRVWISSSTCEEQGWGRYTVIQKVKMVSTKLYSKF